MCLTVIAWVLFRSVPCICLQAPVPVAGDVHRRYKAKCGKNMGLLVPGYNSKAIEV